MTDTDRKIKIVLSSRIRGFYEVWFSRPSSKIRVGSYYKNRADAENVARRYAAHYDATVEK